MRDVDWESLFREATSVRLRAHAPYSQFQVGATLLCSDGSRVSGCNLENATFGLTVCAERNAMAQAVAAAKTPIALAIVTAADNATPPCGACRQVLAEFCEPTLPVCSRTLNGKEARYTLADLLPFAFAAKDFVKTK